MTFNIQHQFEFDVLNALVVEERKRNSNFNRLNVLVFTVCGLNVKCLHTTNTNVSFLSRLWFSFQQLKTRNKNGSQNTHEVLTNTYHSIKPERELQRNVKWFVYAYNLAHFHQSNNIRDSVAPSNSIFFVLFFPSSYYVYTSPLYSVLSFKFYSAVCINGKNEEKFMCVNFRIGLFSLSLCILRFSFSSFFEKKNISKFTVKATNRIQKEYPNKTNQKVRLLYKSD